MSEGRLPESFVAMIPCYNAGDRIRAVAEGLLELVPRVMVIDDGSTDGCIDLVRDLPVQIVTLPENHGKGYALMAGYRAALEDSTVTCVASLDADGQHDPAELPGLYKRFCEEKADFLIGAREFSGEDVPFRSRFGNTVTVTVVGWLLGQKLQDTQSGYRLLSRAYIQDMLPLVTGGRYETEMELMGRAIRGDYTVTSAPIQTIYEEGNKSSHFRKVSDSIRIYRTLLRVAIRVRR